MLISESTTSQHKNNCVLFPISGLQRRTFPDLEEEIGEDPAALLPQLDYWIGNRGFEQDGHRWLRISAKNISAWAFRTWSQRKVQRVLKALREADLILIEYFDGPYTTPYIALNKTAINEKLKSVRIIDPAEQGDQPVSDEIEDQTPATAKWTKGSTPTSKAVPSTTPAASEAATDPSDNSSAPCITVEAALPSTAVTTYKDQLDHESTAATGIQSEKRSERQRKIIKRESALRADRAKRGTSSLNGEKQAVVGGYFASTKKSEWDKFCEKLAEICGIDFDLEPGYIRAWASKLWKKGKGYTVEDLEDFIVWWNKYDWRGAKNKTRPYPKQVCECIRQSSEHEHTKYRRFVREMEGDPDDEIDLARFRYIFGENAQYVRY